MLFSVVLFVASSWSIPGIDSAQAPLSMVLFSSSQATAAAPQPPTLIEDQQRFGVNSGSE